MQDYINEAYSGHSPRIFNHYPTRTLLKVKKPVRACSAHQIYDLLYRILVGPEAAKSYKKFSKDAEKLPKRCQQLSKLT